MLEADFLDTRKIFFELYDVLIIGASPAVDRLIVVSDDRDVFIGKETHELVLLPARVLKFVDHDVRVARAVFCKHVGVFMEQADRQHDEIVEVDRIVQLQSLLVRFVERAVHIVCRLPIFAPGFYV